MTGEKPDLNQVQNWEGWRILRPWPDSKRIPIFRSKWGCKKENPCGEVAHFKGLSNDFSECFRSLQRPTVEITLGSPKKAHARASAHSRFEAKALMAIGRAMLPRGLARPQRGVASVGISRRISHFTELLKSKFGRQCLKIIPNIRKFSTTSFHFVKVTESCFRKKYVKSIYDIWKIINAKVL